MLIWGVLVDIIMKNENIQANKFEQEQKINNQ